MRQSEATWMGRVASCTITGATKVSGPSDSLEAVATGDALVSQLDRHQVRICVQQAAFIVGIAQAGRLQLIDPPVAGLAF